jgi:hypothetical protein
VTLAYQQPLNLLLARPVSVTRDIATQLPQSGRGLYIHRPLLNDGPYRLPTARLWPSAPQRCRPVQRSPHLPAVITPVHHDAGAASGAARKRGPPRQRRRARARRR